MNDTDQYKHVPQELKEKRQWICWKNVPERGKIPTQTKGLNASTDDPDTWTTFDEAVKYQHRYGNDGIGFVFTENDPYGGIDFDDFLVDGQLVDEASEIISLTDSYAEISPSGNGVKIFGLCPPHPDGMPKKTVSPDGKRVLETYTTGRFFTVTGNVLPGHEKLADIGEAYELANVVMCEWKGIKSNGSKRQAKPKRSQDLWLRGLDEWSRKATDEQVLFAITETKQADSLRAFMVGDTATFKRLFPKKNEPNEYDHSSVDFSFASMIAFYTQDAEQVERIMRLSALNREKWDRDDYLPLRTIPRAIEGLENVYLGAFPTVPSAWTFDAWLNGSYRDEIAKAWEAQLFDGTKAVTFQQRTEWLVAKYIERGSLNMFFGDPAGFKSLLTMSIAAHVATGKWWLSSPGMTSGYEVQKAPVLWIDKDNGKVRSMGNLGAILRAMDVDSEASNFHMLSMSDPPFFTQREQVDALISLIDKNGYGLIVIDNLGLVTYEDENSSAMAHTLSEFRRIAEETGCAVIIIHHANKGNNDGQTKMRGSTSIAASLDYGFYVKRNIGQPFCEVLCVKNRGNFVPTSIMNFRYEHWTGTEDLFKASFEYGGRKTNNVQETILATLANGPQRTTDLRKIVMDETGKGARVVNNEIQNLMGDGIIVEVTDPNDGRVKHLRLV